MAAVGAQCCCQICAMLSMADYVIHDVKREFLLN